jgi:hypothetical protein
MKKIFTFLISITKLVVIKFALLFIAFALIAEINFLAYACRASAAPLCEAAIKQIRLGSDIVDINNKYIFQIKILFFCLILILLFILGIFDSSLVCEGD